MPRAILGAVLLALCLSSAAEASSQRVETRTYGPWGDLVGWCQSPVPDPDLGSCFAVLPGEDAVVVTLADRFDAGAPVAGTWRVATLGGVQSTGTFCGKVEIPLDGTAGLLVVVGGGVARGVATCGVPAAPPSLIGTVTAAFVDLE